MPGLLRGIARTAVVAGTATAVSGRVRRRQARRWAAEEEPEPYAPGPAPAPQPAPSASGGTDDMLDALERLGKLRDSGVLSDAEFAAQKQRILGS